MDVDYPFSCPDRPAFTPGDQPKTLRIDITYGGQTATGRIRRVQNISKTLWTGLVWLGRARPGALCDPGRVSEQELDPEVIELARRAFTAARAGAAQELEALVSEGVP